MTAYTITVKKNNHENREPVGAQRGYSLLVEMKRAGGDQTVKLHFTENKSVIDTLDEALGEFLRRMARAYDVADVTITSADYTLNLAQQTTLKEKYELEAQINSVTFA